MADDAPREAEDAPQLDIGWKHGVLIDAAAKRVKCNYCGKEMNGGVFRLKQHIAGIGGNVAKCKNCPREIVNEMKEYMSGRQQQKGIRLQHQHELQEEISGTGRPEPIGGYGKGKGKTVMQEKPTHVHDSSEEGEEDVDPMEEVMRLSRRTAREEQLRRSQSERQGSSGVRPTMMDAFLHRKPSTKQPGIKQAIKGVKATAAAAKKAIKNITKWFLHAGVPAHTVKSEYFQTMIDSIAEAGPGLKAPTAKELYGKLLEEELQEIKDWVESFKAVWMARGCTIMCDGWTGTTRRSMINFLVYCSEGTVFMKSVDASGKIKNADYLFRLMDEMVEEVGEENVVQVVTDNEASYKAAGKKLMQVRPHLYWVPCAAHSLDLMMEDIGKDKYVEDLVGKAQMITSFIYGHNRILHMLRDCTSGHDIIRPGPTRFASNFIALESLHKYRHELGTLIHSSDYLAHVATLREESRNTAHEIAYLISDHRFWDKVSYYLKLIEPLVQVLRMVDGEDKNDMGYIYEAMDKAKERLKEKHPTAFKKWWRIIDSRWESTLHHDLHAAGYFFNPRQQYSPDVHNDGEVLEGTINVISRLSRSTEERIDAMMEMDRFKLKLDIYGDRDLKEAVSRTGPAEWWIMLDYKTKQTNPLARIAVRVLSQTTSSSQCERNWSTFSLIHTKVRNRLSPTKLEKLVYCHYNMRLKIKCIKQRQKKEEQRLMSFAGRHWEQRYAETEGVATTPTIDVEELLDEEHPLNAWVESRKQRDVSEFDPMDVSWAEGELDGVEARDPELRVSPPSHPSEPEPEPTHPRVPMSQVSQPALRRAATTTERTQRSSSEWDQERITYMRQKKRRVLFQRQRSTHSSDDDDDDDDGGDGAATGATTTGARAGHGGDTSGASYGAGPAAGYSSGVPETEHQGGGGSGEGQREYEGQHQAAYGWPSWEPHYSSGSTHIPAFQPPILPYSDISSSPLGVEGGWGPWPSQEQGDNSEATSTYRPLGIWCPASSQSTGGESSSQQYTPRGIQRGMHDLANSLFGYGYNVNEESSSSQWQNY